MQGAPVAAAVTVAWVSAAGHPSVEGHLPAKNAWPNRMTGRHTESPTHTHVARAAQTAAGGKPPVSPPRVARSGSRRCTARAPSRSWRGGRRARAPRVWLWAVRPGCTPSPCRGEPGHVPADERRVTTGLLPAESSHAGAGKIPASSRICPHLLRNPLEHSFSKDTTKILRNVLGSLV